MDYNRIDFKEAVRELADKVGLEYGKCEMDDGKREKSKVRSIRSEERYQKKRNETKIIILKSEKEFFDEKAGIYEYMMGLEKNESEVKAMEDLLNERKEKQILIYESLEKFCFGVDEETLEYLLGRNRGLKPETIKKFRLFSIKDLKTTTEFLRDCFSSDDLLISGLMNPKGKFVFTYHKLIIPFSENNKIVYLRGRKLQKADSNRKISKYISLSNFEGMLPLKRFYNIDILKIIYPDVKLFVTEGEFDCEIMVQEGFNAIGIPGTTNIPENQIHLIKDYDIYAAFDNDDAGIKAMHRLVKLVNKPIKAIKLKHNKDLTELINERSGRNI